MTKLGNDFSKVRRTKVWNEIPTRKGGSLGISGGVYSIESNFKDAGGTWNPHLHILIESTGRLPKSWIHRLRAEWFRITGNAKVVHLDPVYSVSRTGRKLYHKVSKKAIRELVKYTTKCADFSRSPERVDEFLTAFENVRRVQTFGSFHGVDEDPENEPGSYEPGLIGCKCGKCTSKDGEISAVPVHVSDTVLMADGTRQLKFAFADDWTSWPTVSPPAFKLESLSPVRSEQMRISFNGALPVVSEELPSLFAA